ncbi:MAG: hypothetical protein JWM50_968 [Microbacteriaceae bacterium]|jgi:hypothetical protein|nr:hypothetical protein [Microbacteriaceae bacterium]
MFPRRRRRILTIAAAFAVFAALGAAAATLQGMETTAGTDAESSVVQDAIRP